MWDFCNLSTNLVRLWATMYKISAPLVPSLALFSGPSLVPILSGARGSPVGVLGGLGRDWSGWHPHLGCARRRRPASGQSWSHHGTWDRPGRDADALGCLGSRATGFGTPGDENFWISLHFCDLVLNYIDIISKATKYKMSACSFRTIFESRDSDCTIVSGALNNPG